MIKINLLPASVFEKQIVRRLIMLFGMLLALIIAGGFGYRMTLSNALAEKQAELQRTQLVEQEVLATEQQATQEKAKIGPIQSKVNFIRDMMAYNEQAPRLYEELARFTYDKIRYRSISLTDAEMVIEAHAPSLSDAGRYLLNLYRATHIFSQVSMDSVPQFSSKDVAPAMDLDAMGQAMTKLQSDPRRAAALQGRLSKITNPQDAMKAMMSILGSKTPRRSTAFDFKVTCTLAKPLAAPSYSGGGGAAAGTPGAAAAPASAPAAGGGYAPPGGSPPGGPPGGPMSPP